MGKKSPRQSRTNSRAVRRKAKNYSVFVSHASADKWVAKTMCEKIDSQGAESFRDDRDIDGGDDIPEKIRQAIKKCQDFVVLLSPLSLKRDWVRLEMGAAWGWKKRVIIVLMHVGDSPFPATFQPKKYYSINDFDVYLREISQRLSGDKS